MGSGMEGDEAVHHEDHDAGETHMDHDHGDEKGFTFDF